MNTSSWSKCFVDYTAEKYFLACSGGVDSMVLCFLMKQANLNFELLHVNFQLRGQASREDEKLVCEYGKKIGVKVHTTRFETLKIQHEQGGNLEELCRNLRYTWFQTFLDKTPHSKLVVAHHQNDTIETFYLQLARKAGIVGLSSLKAMNGTILRPLLDFTKAEIYAFARKKNIPWREDKSNGELDFSRNKLRNEILPFLERNIQGFNQSVLTLIDVFQQAKNNMENKVKSEVYISNHFELSIAVFQAWTIDERYVFLNLIKVKTSFLLEIQKLETAMIGKFIETKDWVISKSKNGFWFDKKEDEILPELLLEKVTELPKNFDKTSIYLDEEKICGKLILRKWEDGDRMNLLGVNGSKRVSKIINEAHLSVYEKKNTLVLADDKTIHWIVGVKIGGKAVATSDTTTILKVSIVKKVLPQ